MSYLRYVQRMTNYEVQYDEVEHRKPRVFIIESARKGRQRCHQPATISTMMSAADVVEVLNALETAGVEVWVQGGWGVDALLAEQTRPHDDLDIIHQMDDVATVMQVARNLGFSVMTDALPQGFVLCDSADRRIDCHPVRFRNDGSAVQEITDVGEWVFSAPGMLGVGSIGGRAIRCLTPEEEVTRATDQPGCPGYEPDESDRRDTRLLRDRFGITLPYPFTND